MGKIIPIVVLSENEGGRNYKSYSRPIVKYINDEDLKILAPIAANGLTQVIEQRPGGRSYNYMTPIKPEDLEVLRNPATTDYALLSRKQVAVTGVGTSQATTLILRKYNELTTLGVGATDACKLPAAPAINDCVCVINNDASGDALLIFPNTGHAIDALSVNASYSLAANARVFLVYTATNKWQTALDYGR